MNENILFKLNFFILLLIPLAILSGPAIPDILVSSSGILFIILSIKYRMYNYYRSFFFVIFLFFYFLIILSSLFSSDILFSFESSLFYFRFGIFALNIWFVIENTKKFLKLFSISITFSIIIAFTSGYIQYISLIEEFKINNFRVSGIFDDELVLGSFVSRILPTSIGLIIFCFYKKNKAKAFYLLISIYFCLSIIITIVSGERVAIINMILLSILIIIFIDFKFKFFLSFLIVISFTSLLYLDERIYDRLVLKTYYDLIKKGNQTNEKLEIYFVSKEHHYTALTAFNMFKKNIFIGIGPKMFRKHCLNKDYLENIDYGGSCYMHPHNSYLQLLAEVGIIPVIIILSLFLFIIYKLIKIYNLKNKHINHKISSLELYLYIAVLITLWPLNQNGNFFNNWLNVIYYLPVGIILSLNNIKENFDEKKTI